MRSKNGLFLLSTLSTASAFYIPVKRTEDSRNEVVRNVTGGRFSTSTQRPVSSSTGPNSTFNLTANSTNVDVADYIKYINLCDLGIVDCNSDSDDDSNTDHEEEMVVPAPSLAGNATRRGEHRSLLGKRSGRKLTVTKGKKFFVDIAKYPYPWQWHSHTVNNFQPKEIQNPMDSDVKNTGTLESTLKTNTEHAIEANTLPEFINWVTKNDPKMYNSFKTTWGTALDDDALEEFSKMFPWAPETVKSATRRLTFNDIYSTAGGANPTEERLFLIHDEINRMKSIVWRGNNLDPAKHAELVSLILNGEAHPEEILYVYRSLLSVSKYLNEPRVEQEMKAAQADQTELLENFFKLTGENIVDKDGKPVELHTKYQEFLEQKMPAMERHLKKQVSNLIEGLREIKPLPKKKQGNKPAVSKATKITELKNKGAQKAYAERIEELEAEFEELEKEDAPRDTQEQEEQVEEAKENYEDAKQKAEEQLTEVTKIDADVLEETTDAKRQDVRSANNWGAELDTLRGLDGARQAAGRDLYSAVFELKRQTPDGLKEIIDGFKEQSKNLDTLLTEANNVQLPAIVESDEDNESDDGMDVDNNDMDDNDKKVCKRTGGVCGNDETHIDENEPERVEIPEGNNDVDRVGEPVEGPPVNDVQQVTEPPTRVGEGHPARKI